MTNNSKIDILMTTYNGEKYLKEQIESILNQTYKNINLIISDDCSTDNTRDILKEYQDLENIKIYYQDKNLGYVANFEFLLKHVESDIYMLSDQDDVWMPNKIEETFKKLEEDNADLVFTDLEVVNQKLELINKSFNKSMNKEHKIGKTLGTNQFEYLYNNITGCTIMSKKKWIDEILPIPKGSKYVIHDSWIGLIISLNGKISYLDKPTIKYRQHSENQVGTERESYKYNDFGQVRNLFINVKKDLFKTYLENQQKFPEELQKLNYEGKKFFDDIEKIISVKLKQIINDNTHVIIFFLNSNVLNLFQIKINNIAKSIIDIRTIIVVIIFPFI